MASFVNTFQVACSAIHNLFEMMLSNRGGDCAFGKQMPFSPKSPMLRQEFFHPHQKWQRAGNQHLVCEAVCVLGGGSWQMSEGQALPSTLSSSLDVCREGELGCWRTSIEGVCA